MAGQATARALLSIHAEAGLEEEVAQFLTGALEHANAEAGTPIWLALRSDKATFWIVDAFPSDTERQAHLDGPIAAALMQNAERLLATAPEINKADVLAAKIPG